MWLSRNAIIANGKPTNTPKKLPTIKPIYFRLVCDTVLTNIIIAPTIKMMPQMKNGVMSFIVVYKEERSILCSGVKITVTPRIIINALINQKPNNDSNSMLVGYLFFKFFPPFKKKRRLIMSRQLFSNPVDMHLDSMCCYQLNFHIHHH